MIVATHKTPDGKGIVAICDTDLYGKKFKEKNVQLDLSSNFYKGHEKSEQDILKILDTAYVVNLVGKGAVELGIKKGIIIESNVICVKKVPHAQAILF